MRLSGAFRVLLAQLKLELEQLAARIEQMDRVTQKIAKENEACQRLTEIPGVGPVTATALIGAIGDTSTRLGKGEIWRPGWGSFRESTPPVANRSYWASANGAISYLRRLFVQGARSVLQQRHKQAPGLSDWLGQLLGRTHQNVVVVALANKMVRMAWAVLCKNERYRAPELAVSA